MCKDRSLSIYLSVYNIDSLITMILHLEICKVAVNMCWPVTITNSRRAKNLFLASQALAKTFCKLLFGGPEWILCDYREAVEFVHAHLHPLTTAFNRVHHGIYVPHGLATLRLL